MLLSIRRLRARIRAEGRLCAAVRADDDARTGTLATSAIAYSSWNYGSTKRSDADTQALALAEAGLNYAFSTLYNSGTPTMASAVPSRTITLSTGDASYYGTLTGSTWKLVGVGTVRNPTGPGQRARRPDREREGGARLGAAAAARTTPSGTTSTSTTRRDDEARQLGQRQHPALRARQPRAHEHRAGLQLRAPGRRHARVPATPLTSARPTTPIHEAHVGGGCRVGSTGAFSKPAGPPSVSTRRSRDSTPTSS